MASIFNKIVRGATILEGQGGYSKDKRDVVMVVINRYEIHDLQIAVAEADPNAFVNIIQSLKVSGRFLSRDQQKSLRKEVAQIELETTNTNEN
nr:YitT family protein [Fundicoccus ignavus]